MSNLNPPQLNPQLSFPDNSQLPEMSVDGIVIDKVYGATGVLDTLQNTTASQYQDPNSNQINPPSQGTLPNQGTSTVWYSSLVDDVYNTGFALSFQFSKTTYINYVTFDLLNVPCSWQLLQVSGTYSPLIGGTLLAQGIVNGTNNQGWINFEETLAETYLFNNTINLVLVLTKLQTGTQYNFGVQNFLTKLVVQTIEDLEINGNLINSFTTQNSFGFVETFTPEIYNYSNFQISGQPSIYWKSTPQPVKDSIVWFTVDFGQTAVIDRMFIDPLYTGPIMNMYYSNGTSYNNLIPPPSDSFETGIGNWISTTSTTLEQSSAESLSGQYSLETIDTGGGTTANLNLQIPVTANEEYTLLASFYPSSTPRSVYANIYFYNSSGEISFISGFVTEQAGEWSQLVCNGFAPSGATYALISFGIESTVTNEIHYVDCVSFAPGTSTIWGPGNNTLDANSNWTPVNQDFTLHKGMYSLNTICARYLKLEFTQLVPEVYDLPFDSINRVIQVFPDYVDTYFLGLEQALLDAPAQSYNNLVGNSPNVLYNNAPSITSNYGALAGQLTTNQYGGSPSNLGLANLGDNSSSYSVVDPTVSYKNLQDVANEGSIFSNVGDTPFMNRRFYQYGPHTYKEVLINQTWHEAYFVGIKYLSFYNINQIGFPQ